MTEVVDHPDLRERELTKMGILARAMTDALVARGVPAAQASLASEVGVLAFRLAYERWAAGQRSQKLAPLRRVVLDELGGIVARD